MQRRRPVGAADARVLIHPAATYRQQSANQATSNVVGRLLILLVAVGSTVSLCVSGRLSLRLIADGAVSFAFLPAFVVAGFTIVYFGRRDRPLPFARAFDLFLTGLLPWLLWLIALSTICSIVPPRSVGPWIWPLQVSVLAPAIWSTVIDFHFFREAMARSARAATRDLLLYRLVAWGAATIYFFGIAAWYEIVPRVMEWIRG